MNNLPDYEVLANLNVKETMDLEDFRDFYTGTLPPRMYDEAKNTLTISGAQTLALLTYSDTYFYSLPNLLHQVKALQPGESMRIGGLTSPTFDATVRVTFARQGRKVSIIKDRENEVTNICDTTNQ